MNYRICVSTLLEWTGNRLCKSHFVTGNSEVDSFSAVNPSCKASIVWEDPNQMRCSGYILYSLQVKTKHVKKMQHNLLLFMQSQWLMVRTDQISSQCNRETVWQSIKWSSVMLGNALSDCLRHLTLNWVAMCASLSTRGKANTLRPAQKKVCPMWGWH